MNFKATSEPQADKKVKVWVLISATSIGAFLASLDGTIVNISLPEMMDSLCVAQHQIQWVVLCYLLTMIAFTTQNLISDLAEISY